MSQTTSTVVETPHITFGSSLPAGWRWVQLKDICIQITDGTHKTPNYQPSGVRFISIANIKPFQPIDWNTYEKYISAEEHKELTKRCKPEWDDILVAKIGTLGIAKIIDFEEEVSIFVGLALLKPNKSHVLPKYLEAYLNSPTIKEYAKAGAQGSGRQTLPLFALQSFPVPLPPLDEQERIVKILSAQITSIEQARAAAEAQLKAAKDLPAAYLRESFNSTEARQWERKRIGDVALLVQNGIYKAAEHYGYGHPFLRMYNVQNNSWTLNLDRIALVNLEGKEEQTFALKRGDLLISRVNSFELVGKCAWVSSEAEGFVFENMLIRVQLDSSVNSLFIAQQMATDTIRKQIEAVAKRAIGQASINSADLRAIEIALPPLAVQEQIANELSAQVADAERVSKTLQDQLNAINKLPAALLRQAFTGKL